MNSKRNYLVVFILLIVSFFIDKYINIPRIGFFDYMFKFFSSHITIAIMFIVIISLFAYNKNKQKWVKTLLTTILLTGLLSIALKLLIARPRPGTVGLLNLSFNMFSMPSMHSALVFCLLPLLQKEFKKIKNYWIIIAIIIAFSRMYLNVHFLSDVIAGALLGFFIGEILYDYKLKVDKNRIEMNNRKYKYKKVN